LKMERIDFPKRQVKPQRGHSSLSLTGAKPRFSRSGAITPQVNTLETQKSLKCISSPRESLKVTINVICLT
jgi:hypothetical protein